jgi:Phage XkdN-like protein.
MYNKLEAFLALPDVANITEDVFINDRLGTFKVKPMTTDAYAAYRKQCTGTAQKGGADFDFGKYQLLIVTGQVVQPNFADADFLGKAGCATAREFVARKFKPGEIAEIAEKINTLSGFNTDDDELIEEAKN